MARLRVVRVRWSRALGAELDEVGYFAAQEEGDEVEVYACE
jgi:hypothetical protein